MAEKKKCKPRGGNSPVIGNNGLMTEPGDTTHYLNLNLELMKLPTIDKHNVVEVQERIATVFEIFARYDTKPTVSGMAMALGMTRQTLSAIAHDKTVGGNGYETALPQDVADSIKKAYAILESLWENYMTNGKINPVSGIFLAKNNFDYRDQTETVITPNVQKEQYSTESIRERYLLPEPGEDDDPKNE